MKSKIAAALAAVTLLAINTAFADDGTTLKGAMPGLGLPLMVFLVCYAIVSLLVPIFIYRIMRRNTAILGELVALNDFLAKQMKPTRQTFANPPDKEGSPLP